MDATNYSYEIQKESFSKPSAQKLITLSEYESTPEDTRIEVIDGVPYDMASPTIIHQDIAGYLFVEITNYLRSKKGKCRAFIAPLDVKLKDDPLTIVQPDVFVVCDKDKLDDKRVNGAPDWVIEIVSPSAVWHDYIKKLNLYLSAGVREYWIVNPLNQQITVYRFEEKNTMPETYTFGDTIKVGIYDDLSIDFATMAEATDIS